MKKLFLGAVLMFASFVVSAASVEITPVSNAFLVDVDRGVYFEYGNESIYELSSVGDAQVTANISFTTSLNNWSYSLFEGSSRSVLALIDDGVFLANTQQGFTFTLLNSVVYTLVLRGESGATSGFISNFQVS